MKRLAFLFSVAFFLISLFNSCQKEEYKNQHLKLILDVPVNTGGTTWLFSGKILTSGKVDLSNHGFDMMLGSIPARFELGSLQKGGKIEISRDLPGGVTPSNVVFYAADYYGKVYTSNESSMEMQVSISNPHHTSDFTYEYFSATITNLQPTQYVVFDYGIDFRLASSSEYTQSFQFQLPVDNYNMTIPIYREIEGTSGTFLSGQNYIFRFYTQVRKLSDGTISKVYSTEGSFTAIML